MAATFSLKSNRSSVHISGLAVRTEGSDFNYSQTACPTLTRSRNFEERGTQAATAAEALAEARTLALTVSGRKVCKHCEAAALAMIEADEAAAEAAAPAAPVVREVAIAAPAARTSRPAQGAASVTGWELLYDKPKDGAEVGRRYKGAKAQYALICKAHGHVHALPRLTSERALRSTGGWCPSC